ncbi:MAG: hypothetical protein RR246_03270 [Clostridia bacterium]
MEFYVIVLEKTEFYEKIISALNNAGISGATTITSVSMETSLSTREDSHIIAALRAFMTVDRIESKTIFGVCAKEQVIAIRDAVVSVVGDINNSNTAMIVSLPISFVDGIYQTTETIK